MNAAASSFELDKKRIIQWVQGISEPKLLERIKYLMATESDADWRDDISEDERKAIEEGIQQINAGQWVTHEEVKKQFQALEGNPNQAPPKDGTFRKMGGGNNFVLEPKNTSSKAQPSQMKPTEKQIEEIAEDLDCGMRCYYNLKTGEIKAIPDFDNLLGGDEEPWEDEINELEENWADYFEFKGLGSRDSFRIMADFAEGVANAGIQDRLINALNRPKPFQNFKFQIDNSGEYRQQWFDFNKMRYVLWVKKQIDSQNFDSHE